VRNSHVNPFTSSNTQWVCAAPERLIAAQHAHTHTHTHTHWLQLQHTAIYWNRTTTTTGKIKTLVLPSSL